MAQFPNHANISAVEAIIYIAHKEWLPMPQLSEKLRLVDILWDSRFSTIGFRRIAKDKKETYDIEKSKLLLFAEGIVDSKEWEDVEWRKAQNSNSTTSIKAMNMCLQEALTSHNLSLDEFIKTLRYSIEYQSLQFQKLAEAEQQLLNAARNEKIVIYGTLKDGGGDIVSVPMNFLLRTDYKIGFWDNRFAPSSNAFPVTEPDKRAKILADSWHYLQVKQEDVLKLWTETSSQTKKIPAKRGKPAGSGAIDDSAALNNIAKTMAEYLEERKTKMPVKSACESVASSMNIPKKNSALRLTAGEEKCVKRSLDNKWTDNLCPLCDHSKPPITLIKCQNNDTMRLP